MSAYDKLDLERYSRQIPVFHMSGQIRLAESAAAVVGLGGLGSLISYYLAAAGVGKLVLVDGESVELSNLNRQILYETEDIGLPKAVLAAKRLKGLNPNVDVVPHPKPIDRSNVSEVLDGVDIIIDALDDWSARLVLDEFAEKTGVPLIHGAVDGLFGQATTVVPGKTPCLACIAPKRLGDRGCRAAVGPVVGLIASLEALEALKILSGLKPSMAGYLVVVDARDLHVDVIKLEKVDCGICRSRISL
ncbi:MAG: HesA/MoeB/ThiF family protein [Desulfurococcales archaeon]|nr:HesA/MoeB/ThiF family protein [Desulfurococcales archaeon]